MRFMIIRKADQETESETMPADASGVFEDMGNYNEEMINAGVMLAGEGLHPSSKGAKVRFVNGKATVIDGPFSEAKELIAGFSMIQVNSKEEAIEWALRWPPSDAHGNVRLEIRQVFESDDFGEEFTPELREQEEKLAEQMARNAGR